MKVCPWAVEEFTYIRTAQKEMGEGMIGVMCINRFKKVLVVKTTCL